MSIMKTLIIVVMSSEGCGTEAVNVSSVFTLCCRR